MKFGLFILLLGVSLPHWTTAGRKPHRPSVERSKVIVPLIRDNSTHMDLSHHRLHHINQTTFNDSKTIESLDLSYNELRRLDPSTFSGLPNLERLSLADNKIESFDDAFLGLNNLTYVDLSSNNFQTLQRSSLSGLPESAVIYFGKQNDLPPEPENFEDVWEERRRTDFTKNQYNWVQERRNLITPGTIICKTMYDSGSVKSVGEKVENIDSNDYCIKERVIEFSASLDLGDLRLQKFERNWYKLENNEVKALRLYKNHITDIAPELLNHLPSVLVDIDLNNNNITIIRKNVIENGYIKGIMLDDNLISTIEDGAFKNTNLTTLYIRRNRLTDLAFVKTLPVTMTHLYLSQNPVRVIPANTFQGLKKLEELELGDSDVEIIQPGAFEDLESVIELRLHYNKIIELEPGVFRGLEKLTTIDLSFNRIKKIPQGVISRNNIPNIAEISLYHNQIDTIGAKSLSHLNLTRISLGVNNITEGSIARDTFEGSAIEFLELNDNLISEINESFPDISGVENLYLVRNRIRNITKGAIKNSPNLKILDLSENPLNHLQNSVFSELSFKNVRIGLFGVPIEYIRAGVFKNV